MVLDVLENVSHDLHRETQMVSRHHQSVRSTVDPCQDLGSGWTMLGFDELSNFGIAGTHRVNHSFEVVQNGLEESLAILQFERVQTPTELTHVLEVCVGNGAPTSLRRFGWHR